MLQKLPEVPAALRAVITGGAEGNPFYMEELVKMLIDRGAIETGHSWKVNAERLLVTKVPPTLAGVLQARLDGLPSEEKLTLQAASVIGPVFWDKVLLAIDARAVATVPSLVDRGLVLPHPDAGLEGLREYAFRHQLLHQVTYDTVLKGSKRNLHAQVAQWLSNLKGLRASDFLGATAEHYERAGDTAHAAEFHARAAEHAGGRLGHEAVHEHVARALALLDDADNAELRWRLLVARESTLHVQARRDEQAADLEVMERLAEALADDAKRAHTALRRSGRAMEMGDLATQESTARCAIRWAERGRNPKQRLNALRHLAAAQVAHGDVDSGKALLEEGLAEARVLGLRLIEAKTLTTLSVVANARNDPLELLELTRQSLKIYQEIGELRGEACALGNLGTTWLILGDLAEARRYSEQALRAVRAYGDRFLEANVLCTLSSAALYQNDDARALSLARSALDVVMAAKARSWEAFALLKLGDAELALGRHSAAHEAFARAQAVALEIDDTLKHDAAAGLARVALAEGNGAAALQAMQPVLDHIEGGGTLEGTEARMIEWTMHRVLAQANDPRAGEWLARARDALQAQAERLATPELRHGFLNNIPHHREIVAAWDRERT